MHRCRFALLSDIVIHLTRRTVREQLQETVCWCIRVHVVTFLQML
jgi:hypothetical protein